MSIETQAAPGRIEILIVEDSSTQAERLGYLLDQHHYQIAVVEDGRMALNWLERHRPGLIITDINMPRLNGYELCRAIKADPQLRDIPVILLTILSDAKDVLEGLACGADSFITKPYSEDYLVARVEQSLLDAAQPHSRRASLKVEITMPGRSGVISADPHRMVSMLMSTYEAAIQRNTELVETQAALRTLNERLEDLVEERTAVLSAEIAERQLAQTALAQTNELLSQAEAIGRIGSWEHDLVTNRVVWSQGLYDILGLTPEDTSPSVAAYLELIHPDDRQPVEQVFTQAVTSTTALEYENRIVLSNGAVRSLSSRVKLFLNARGRPERMAGVAVDITARKQRERELEAVAAISIALRAANTQAQMLPIVLEQITRLLDASAAAVAMRHLGTDELEIVLGRGEMASQTGVRLPAGSGIGGQALLTGRPYVSTDLSVDPNWYQVGLLSEPRAAVCVPLITSQNILGTLWALRAAPFSPVEVSLLESIAGIAASAIQRAELYEQTEERLQRLTGLREIDHAIMHSLDLTMTLNVIVAQVTAQLGVDASDILLFSPGFNGLEYAAGRGFRTKAVERTRLRPGEGYAGQSVLEHRLVAVPDIAAGPDPLGRNQLLAAEGFQAMFCVPLTAKGQLVGVLEVFHRTPLHPNADWIGYLEALGGQTAIAVADARLFEDLQRSNVDMRLAYNTTLEGWSAALDLRDKETEGHSQRVTEMTVRLARLMNVSEAEFEGLRWGALLHDIGKMGVPDAILHKPGPLTADEWVVMHQHPDLAYQLLSPIAFLRPALDIPYCHHEKWDGTGYPRQLKREGIPLAARIFAVVDVWDALRSDRSYRAGWPEAKVSDYLREQSGHHFDPTVVDAFFALQAAILQEAEVIDEPADGAEG